MADKTHENIELLAPARNYDALRAAIENGADGVYFGARMFNAREGAGNFDEEELKRAIYYCRLKGVKSYLTLNILIGEREMERALKLANDAYNQGIDGLIVQDPGVAALIKKHIPGCKIHGSTQMTIYDKHGVVAMENLGFDRVVLARELSREEIGEISRNTSMDLEVFVHGSLCISYSGQCLMSSIIGGRSGNRGRCAQPCRLPVSIGKRGLGYHLSPKDLCTIGFLKDITDLKVVSLKIEGRMKGAEYVATVVRIYRKYLDHVILKGTPYTVEQQDMDDLYRIFNRRGLTGGFIGNFNNEDFISENKPHGTADSLLIQRARDSFSDQFKRKIPLTGVFFAKVNERPLFKVTDGFSNTVISEGSEDVQAARNIALTKEKVLEQLMKTGNTPFIFNRVDVHMDDGLSLPVRVINAMRRDAIEGITRDRTGTQRENVLNLPPRMKHEWQDKESDITLNICKIRDGEFFSGLKTEGIKRIYIPLEGFFTGSFDKTTVNKLKEEGARVYCSVRAITKGKYDSFFDRGVMKARASGIDGFLLGNPGTILRFKDIKSLDFVCDYHLNIYNSYSMEVYRNMGFSSCTLSVELNLAQISHITDYTDMETEVVSYGRLELMKLEYNPVGAKDHEDHFMTDRKNERMPLFKSKFDDRTIILNSKPIYFADRKNEISMAGVDNMRLDIWEEDLDRVNRLTELYLNGQRDNEFAADFTRGHLTRGV